MKYWGILLCVKCQGSGWEYCQTCEAPCEHDRVCSKCKGNDFITKEFSVDLSTIFEPFKFKSRRHALKALDI